jgi:hypothetical protein
MTSCLSASVTSCRPIEKTKSLTVCWGHSSKARSFSEEGEPMVKLPDGLKTIESSSAQYAQACPCVLTATVKDSVLPFL